MAGVAKQIIGSFEDIGKDVVRETAKVPVAVAEAAFGGAGKGGKGAQAQPQSKMPEAVENIDKQQTQQQKEMIARAALRALAARRTPEESVQARYAREKADRDRARNERDIAAQKQKLPVIRGRPKQGMAGFKTSVKSQQSGSELTANVRQD